MSIFFSGSQSGLTLTGITTSSVIIKAVFSSGGISAFTTPNGYLHDGRYNSGAGLSFFTPTPTDSLRSDNSTIYLNGVEILLVSELTAIVAGDVLEILIDSHAGALTLFANQTLDNMTNVDLTSLQILNATGDTVLNDFDLNNINQTTHIIPDIVGSGVLTARAGSYTITLPTPPVADDASFTVPDDIANGGVVGTYTATDDTAVVGYSLDGSTFTIDNSGVITVLDNTLISVGSLTATVAAIDGAGLTDTALITFNVVSPFPTITGVTEVRLGETATITVDNSVDLSTATVVTATYGGINLSLSGATVNTVDFVVPSSGLGLDVSHDLIITADGGVSPAFSAIFLAPTGHTAVTLTGISEFSWLAVPPYSGNGGSDADNMGVGDQVVYQNLTNEVGTEVVIDDTGIVSMPTGVADGVTVDQTVSWFYLDAQDGYASSNSQVLTLLAPASANPTLNITASSSNLSVGEVSTITFTFSEAVAGFDASDIVVTNGSMGALSGSGASYSAVFTPSLEFNGVGVISVADGSFESAGGDLGIGDDISINIDTVTAPSTSSTLNMAGTGTPDGVYMAKFYNDVLDVLIVSKNVAFLGGNASASLDVATGTAVHSLIVGNNPPVTGMAYVGVTE